MHRSPLLIIGAGIFAAIVVLNLIVFGVSFAGQLQSPRSASIPTSEARIQALQARVADLEAHAQAAGYYPGMNIEQARDQAESDRLWNHAMIRLQRAPSQTTACRDTRSGP